MEEEEGDNYTVSRMTIETDEGSRAMGKAKGNYVTLIAKGLRQRDKMVQDAIAQKMAQELQGFLQRMGLGEEDPVLVVGLGNWNATPRCPGASGSV